MRQLRKIAVAVLLIHSLSGVSAAHAEDPAEALENFEALYYGEHPLPAAGEARSQVKAVRDDRPQWLRTGCRTEPRVDKQGMPYSACIGSADGAR